MYIFQLSLTMRFLLGILFLPFILSASDSINKPKLYTTIAVESALYLGGISYLQFMWYSDKERVPFHYYDDSKGYLQMDKCGHAYTAYLESSAAYSALRNSGMSKKKALLLGGPVGFIFQTPIEIFDGLYEGWGFSWSDMIANAAGSAMFIGQELAWEEQRIRMKFSFFPSEYNQYYPPLGQTVLEQMVNDYNSHTYWLSANISAFIQKENNFPKWLNLALGYSGNGMLKEFSNPSKYRGQDIPFLNRDRQFLLSPDLNWTAIPTNSKFLKGIFGVLNCFKFPFPALELNSRGKLKGYWIYY